MELNIDFIGIDFRKNGILSKLGAEKIIYDYTDGNFQKFIAGIPTS